MSKDLRHRRLGTWEDLTGRRSAAHATIIFLSRFLTATASCSQSVPINLGAISRSRSWAQPRNKLGTERSKNDQIADRRSTTYGKSGLGNNLGTEPAENGVKRQIRADQKSRRDNKLAILDPVCKTSTPGSNPGGASTHKLLQTSNLAFAAFSQEALADPLCSHRSTRRSRRPPPQFAMTRSRGTFVGERELGSDLDGDDDLKVPTFVHAFAMMTNARALGRGSGRLASSDCRRVRPRSAKRCALVGLQRHAADMRRLSAQHAVIPVDRHPADCAQIGRAHV